MKFHHKFICWLGLCLVAITAGAANPGANGRLLYVAVPGIRDYLQDGGHGILVFDVDHGHKFLRRIPAGGLDEKGAPLATRGICAHAETARLYVSTTKTMTCYDLNTDQQLWEKTYDKGCDRMSISPDGKTIYLPSMENDFWYVVDAASGDTQRKIVLHSGSHNTVAQSKNVYLAGLKSPFLAVVDLATGKTNSPVGPFANSIRPFTINAAETLCFVNVNDLLGFEIGDLTTGKKLYRIEVTGYEKGVPKRHGCPSHGIGLTPDEKEVWISDAANTSLHIFDATVLPPKPAAHIKLRDEPGWVTFSIKGDYAYPSTGEVIKVKNRKIITQLKDENGTAVQSEKLLEIDFKDGHPIRTGDQFGIGRAAKN